MKVESVEDFLKRGGEVKKIKPEPDPKWNGKFRYKMNDVKPNKPELPVKMYKQKGYK